MIIHLICISRAVDMLVISYLFASQFQCLGSNVERWSVSQPDGTSSPNAIDVDRNVCRPFRELNTSHNNSEISHGFRVSPHKQSRTVTNCVPGLIENGIPPAHSFTRSLSITQSRIDCDQGKNHGLSQQIRVRGSKLKCNRSGEACVCEWSADDLLQY